MKEKSRRIKNGISKTKTELTTTVGIYLDSATYERMKDIAAIKYIPMAGIARQVFGKEINKIVKSKEIV